MSLPEWKFSLPPFARLRSRTLVVTSNLPRVLAYQHLHLKKDWVHEAYPYLEVVTYTYSYSEPGATYLTHNILTLDTFNIISFDVSLYSREIIITAWCGNCF